MYLGIPNPNILVPLKKLKIKPESGSSCEKVEVLYNPDSYTQSRQVRPIYAQGSSGQKSYVMAMSAGKETLQFRLFFDSMSAGSEVGGDMLDKLKFTANSLLPSLAKIVDVRKYTEKIYKYMEIDENLHHLPRLTLEWDSLEFEGMLMSCQQNFVKFNETGMPVRAWVSCVFVEAMDPSKKKSLNPLNSPDTTKFRTVSQGDTLWSIAEEEYGQPEQWRAIADANGIVNPRILRTGDSLAVPGL